MTQVSTGEAEITPKKTETTEHEKTREKKERTRPPTKVVIRRLPPTLTKDAFINQISPLPDHDYLYFVRPDKSLGPFAFARAYINFIKQEDIFTFKEQFDNYTFMDKKGNEYPAIVEFAPFQRLPKKRLGRKKDPKMGTLEQDPAFINFMETRAKSAETGTAQHCPLEYFPPPEKKKITTTPLLDFLRQRKVERQRMRDERREERRRKDQERKRLKDAERDKHRLTGKPDSNSTRDTSSDSILKVLRKPEHEKEAKDDNKGSGSKENRTHPPGIKKKEDERQRISNKDKERKERQLPENRQRETKSQGSVKSYRDDRQKQIEIRAQRKLPDDHHRKTGFERGQSHPKSSDSDKGLSTSSSKTAENRRSQEFDRVPSKHSDTRRSQELDHSQSSLKSSEFRKSQDYDRHSFSNRDADHRKPYQNTDRRKTLGDKYESHTKDSEKQSKEHEYKKNYKDTDTKRSERLHSYNRDGDSKQNSYSIKSSRSSYSETDSKKSSRFTCKDEERKQNKEFKEDSLKAEKHDETKKWELLGAKPKKKVSTDESDKTETRNESSLKETLETKLSVSKLPRRNSFDSAIQTETEITTEIEKNINITFGSKEQLKQRKHLDSESSSTSENFDNYGVIKDKDKSNSANIKESEKSESSSDHKYGAKPSKRRGSLDSGDHESDAQGNKGMSRSATGSDWSMEAKLKRNHSLDLDGQYWDTGQGENRVKGLSSSAKNVGDLRKEKDDKERTSETSGSGGDGDSKRDPRVERRIRNKDRPSIEIYRPGMGRFSMQRKEREKGSVSAPSTAGSSMEQESPSSSPSPTPTATSRIPASAKSSKSGTEFRSMTFKRSVSREK